MTYFPSKCVDNGYSTKVEVIFFVILDSISIVAKTYKQMPCNGGIYCGSHMKHIETWTLFGQQNPGDPAGEITGEMLLPPYSVIYLGGYTFVT